MVADIADLGDIRGVMVGSDATAVNDLLAVEVHASAAFFYSVYQ